MTDIAGTALEQLVAEALEQERATKSSFERRAAFVITSSGVLTTLLLGLAAAVTGSDVAELPLFSTVMLLVAVGLFGVAAILSLRVNQPTDYEESSLQGLRDLVSDVAIWKASVVVGLRTASSNRLEILARFRQVNATKGEVLRWAFTAEASAVVAVALSVMGLVASAR